MKKIFISGALNSFGNEKGFLDNCYRMLKLAGEVRAEGFATYVPCNDMLISLANGGLPHHEYYEHDLVWLKECDGLILVPGWSNSKGVEGELEYADNNKIPVFDDIEGLIEYFKH